MSDFLSVYLFAFFEEKIMSLEGQERLIDTLRQLRENLNDSKIYRTNFMHVYYILIIDMICEHLGIFKRHSVS